MKLPGKTPKIIFNNLTWKIAGEAGFGIAVSGEMFSKVCSRGGLNLCTYSEYPSLIRGGHDTFQITISDKALFAPYRTVDFLVALNDEGLSKHLIELSNRALIIYDSDENQYAKEIEKKKDIILCPIPLAKLSKEAGGDRVMRNTVAMGASIAILDYDLSILDNLFKETFAKKGQEIIDININTAKKGYDFIKENFDTSKFVYRLKKLEEPEKLMVIAGNEAMGLGAIKAGVKFYAGYPMTPSSSLLLFMAANQEKYNIVVKHTEDEIAAANMAIGASYAGIRAMTASSGGGFSLMVESLGLAAITETPMVYVDVQRPGPATGLPTWTEQSDLRFILHASQGEFPRIVLAPGDAEEAYYTMIQAHNIAEKYHLPVIVLSDHFLAENPRSFKPFSQHGIDVRRESFATNVILNSGNLYKRYNLNSEDGVSPRTVPGMKNGIFLANSDEHDEYGFSNEESEMRVDMQNKRFKKFYAASRDLPEPVLYGPQNADITVIGWGSTKGPILEAIELLKKDKIKVNYLQLLYIWPFPAKTVSDTLSAAKLPVLIENNMTGQLGGLITEQTGYDIPSRILKYDGRPFFPEELYMKLKSIKSQKRLNKWLQ